MGSFNSDGFKKYVYAANTSSCFLTNRVSDKNQKQRSEEEIVAELESFDLNDANALKTWAEETIKKFKSLKKVTNAFQANDRNEKRVNPDDETVAIL